MRWGGAAAHMTRAPGRRCSLESSARALLNLRGGAPPRVRAPPGRHRDLIARACLLPCLIAHALSGASPSRLCCFLNCATARWLSLCPFSLLREHCNGAGRSGPALHQARGPASVVRESLAQQCGQGHRCGVWVIMLAAVYTLSQSYQRACHHMHPRQRRPTARSRKGQALPCARAGHGTAHPRPTLVSLPQVTECPLGAASRCVRAGGATHVHCCAPSARAVPALAAPGGCARRTAVLLRCTSRHASGGGGTSVPQRRARPAVFILLIECAACTRNGPKQAPLQTAERKKGTAAARPRDGGSVGKPPGLSHPLSHKRVNAPNHVLRGQHVTSLALSSLTAVRQGVLWTWPHTGHPPQGSCMQGACQCARDATPNGNDIQKRKTTRLASHQDWIAALLTVAQRISVSKESGQRVSIWKGVPGSCDPHALLPHTRGRRARCMVREVC